ncbi:uncharacterized protein LOC103939598 [Pyrus x bretschneideri]|uniref:uncharacterized protein LOC103939598 n=1 Tax=Pyrus x bretschneideri TaxID=225117 RepID=UPI00202F8D56|nr:uncharacterized protein LOC103939598 [Pyrus x bretschneideri]
MALSDKQSRKPLIPSFLYSSSSSIALEKMFYARPSGGFTPTATVEGVSARKGLVIPSPREPLGKTEMYSPSFYAACTFGGILSCGPTSLSLSVPRIRFGAKPPSNAAPAPIRLIRNSMSQPAAEVNPDIPKSDTTEVLVQYVVLRRDLIDTWPTGSVVTQGCHASVSAIWSHKDDPITLQYCSPENIDSMHKVTLEVKGEPQIVNLSEKLKSGGIAHKLWIEQPENFPTCLTHTAVTPHSH